MGGRRATMESISKRASTTPRPSQMPSRTGNVITQSNSDRPKTPSSTATSRRTPKQAFSSDKSGYAVFQLPMYSSPETTYTPPAQNVGFLACNGDGVKQASDDTYCQQNGFSTCSCDSGRRRRLLFGGLSYLRSNCRCI